MTRKMTKLSFPYALASSTLGTVFVSMTAVWLAAATWPPLTRSRRAALAFHQFAAALPPVTCPRRRRLDLIACFCVVAVR